MARLGTWRSFFGGSPLVTPTHAAEKNKIAKDSTLVKEMFIQEMSMQSKIYH
jgi:hypothetical protein